MLAFTVVCWPGYSRELCRRERLALSVWCRAVTIVPDTKDWTWVLERPCPECGLNAHGFARDVIDDPPQCPAVAGRTGRARRHGAPPVTGYLVGSGVRLPCP